ncbi:MAG: NADH-quinone oxidoreductase subunit NuoN [Oceanicaulis sp.]|jgi:NADH-quinone oxidoreductase subunit N|uniref:NADH-quinone oxidoreductase subunit NuoN n=1 Tax=unclassified Oceanicaulis TaxID=2632123 RepID=UPI000066D557|nr:MULTISPECIES: NADH-quinone oxidoreductase subunit NuoN [unclassified Oceanicaulis]EAP91076.1 NADH dehydrogenase subunit N [Oceanicaulis sp. HTCC2633]MAB69722.1 NADH-quinone oxidoreductase subunit NuoN [Oceanicaulis sp.]MBC39568.1 NADH-quinone oxidoreductase subunit NuoN [Oceanicaulis sp.]MBG34462.1 NADH-quinone oxidoreductase subunit NuoN [Oceanicaulis sp.]|tara:strand:- start:101 stop:1552 length:1452 start_codon:yes stop_codon:yes gene_type:complete
MTVSTLLADLQLLTPELVLAVGAMALLLIGVYTKGEEKAAQRIMTLATALLILAAGLSVWMAQGPGGTAFHGAFVLDSFAMYAKTAVYLAGAVALVLAGHYLRTEQLARFEFPVLVTLAVLGMSFMVSANDLITLYLGLELQSLALYVLAAFNRDSLRASEAGLKYFVLGALSSGLLLYGSSLVYGFSGSTSFDAIAVAAAEGSQNLGLLFGLVFVVAGLAFKVSAAPFHMWTPDVYEGAPTPVAAFFATAPKLAAMVLLARVLMEPFGPMTEQWQQVTMVMAVLSMAFGSFGALMQSNIKRLMGYSSIGNMGYVLVGLSAGTALGLWSVLFYMTLYVIGVAGAFAVILSMRRSEGMVERIEDLSGLSQTRPALAWSMTALMFSIGGMPFMIGFFGKLFVFYAAVQAGLIWLVILAVIFSTISIAYYLRVIKVIWFDEPTGDFLPAPTGAAIISRLAALIAVSMPVVGIIIALVVNAGAGIGG